MKYKVTAEQGDVYNYLAKAKVVAPHVTKIKLALTSPEGMELASFSKLKDDGNGLIIKIDDVKIKLDYSQADDLHTLLQVWLDKFNNAGIPKTISIEEK